MFRFSDYGGRLTHREQRIACALLLGRAVLLVVAALVLHGEEFSGLLMVVGALGVLVLAEMVLDQSKGGLRITPGYLWVELGIFLMLPLLPWFVMTYGTLTSGQVLGFGFAMDFAWASYRSVFDASPGLVLIYLVSTLGALIGVAVVGCMDHRKPA